MEPKIIQREIHTISINGRSHDRQGGGVIVLNRKDLLRLVHLMESYDSPNDSEWWFSDDKEYVCELSVVVPYTENLRRTVIQVCRLRE